MFLRVVTVICVIYKQVPIDTSLVFFPSISPGTWSQDRSRVGDWRDMELINELESQDKRVNVLLHRTTY